MADRTSYLPGTPSFVDIGSPDVNAAAAFYGSLFGWGHNDLGPDAGGYGMLTMRGRSVAGIGPQQSPDMPPYWTVYITVADADASAAKVSAAGGTVVVPAMDVLDAGRMVVCQDPTGSFFSIWQAKEGIGCEIVNEPGSFCWNELATTDLTTASAFYTAVFDWGTDPGYDGASAAAYTVGGEMVCGAHVAGEGEFPAWSVWFAVKDCEASAAKVTELGGSVFVPPNDMGFGIGAVVADPHGAVFGIAKLHAPA